MKVKIKKSNLNGIINAMPSKSYSHRLIIANALAGNTNKIDNILYSDDIKATSDCVKNYIINNFDDNIIFDCNESGTTLRLLIPILLTKFSQYTIRAKQRLIDRGIDVYENILKNVKFKKKDNYIFVNGRLEPGDYYLPGNISSQYISGLLYSLPLLNSDSSIHITTELESKNYILMTLDVLSKFKIIVDHDDNYKNYYIKGKQKYMGVDSSVEGDYSNASFIDAFNYFNDNNIKIIGLNENSLQSDRIYKNYFEILDKGIPTLDISNCIDLGPVLFAFASLKNGACFIGTKRLKIKESDRAVAMKTELEKFGVDIVVNEDNVIIKKTNIHKPDSILDSHNDHRIVMSLSLFSNFFDIEINDAQAINKSYPDYFEDLKKLGANIEIIN